MNSLSKLSLLAAIVFPAPAMAQGRLGSLAQAQETFEGIDVDKDGKLSPEEVSRKLQLGAADVRGVDADMDGFWSKDEFLVFYRQRLVAANAKPAADLEAEANRILAARKAKAAERGAQRNPSDVRRAANQGAPASAVADAFDELEVKASANQARQADFDRVRNLLVQEARAADLAAGGQDPAAGERSDFHTKFLQSLDRMQAAAASGAFPREEYQSAHALLVRRARTVTSGAGDSSATEARLAQRNLLDAIDQLEQRAAAGRATREDFDRVRDHLASRARAAANSGGSAEAELQGTAQRQMVQALERLQTSAAAGNYSREDYNAFRESIVQRFRAADQGGQPRPAAADNAELRSIEQGLSTSIDQLERRAAAGNATREDFQRVRDQLNERARAAASGSSPAEAEQQATANRKLMQSLDRLEVAAQQGSFSRDDYNRLRELMTQRAREFENPGQPRAGNAAADETAMNQAVDELERRVHSGRISAADFKQVREMLAAREAAASGRTDPQAASEVQVYRKLTQSLGRLEAAAQSGSVDRREFQAFKDSYVQRARAIATESQSSGSTGGRRTGGSETPGSRPAPADPGPAKRPDPPRDTGGRGGGSEPAPQSPPPPARPKPNGERGQ